MKNATGAVFARGAILVGLALHGAGAGAFDFNDWPGDWRVRLRGIVVAPNDDSGLVSVGTPLTAVPGSGVTVDTDVKPELDITYMFHRNFGAELILGTTQHDVTARGSLAGLGGVIDSWVLPPTLTFQYHPFPDSSVRPYVGVGVNWTLFYNESVEGPLDAPGAKVKIDDSWGVAGQIGVDIDMNETWFFNVDMKYIDLDTTAKFKNTAVGAAEVDVDIDPFVWGFGIGRRF